MTADKPARTPRRVVARLYEEDGELLDKLCAKLGASESYVIRHALRALAASQQRTARVARKRKKARE